MSQPLAYARMLADQVADILRPLCNRLLIAGSIRREADRVGDIEIVCIPNVNRYREFQAQVKKWTKVKGEPDGKYTQRVIPGIPDPYGVVRLDERTGPEMVLDLFICSTLTWACNAMIRTGPADFSQAMMTRAPRRGMKFNEGRLYRGALVLPVVAEEEVFTALGLPWIDPPRRGNRESLKQVRNV